MVTGYRVRITEAAGTPLGLLLPSTNPWGPQDCNRLDCITCSQGDEKRIDCRKRNILYESECTICNVGKKDGKEDLKDGKGVYVGESSRSIYERAKEHVADRENRVRIATKSNIGSPAMRNYWLLQDSDLRSYSHSRIHFHANWLKQ